MAEAITTLLYRESLAQMMVDGTPVKPMFSMGFGDGGHDADLKPITPLPSTTSLKNELLRKPLAWIANEDLLSATWRGVLEANELVGARISEAALFNEDGMIIGYKTFSPKFKESDERYEVNIRLRF